MNRTITRTPPTLLRQQSGDKRITDRAYDSAEYENAEDWVNLYLELFCVDRRTIETVPKFYIRDMQAELEKLPLKHKQTLTKYYGLKTKGKVIKPYMKDNNGKDRALEDMTYKAEDAKDYLRAISRISKFHEETKNAITKIAAKVYDPKGEYTDIEKVKYAHIYFLYIKDFQFMPYDNDDNYEILSENAKYVESRLFTAPDFLTDDYDDFLSQVPDGDILIPMIEKFLYQLDEKIEKQIREDSQLLEDRYIQHFFVAIRKAKEEIFSCGEWKNADFCRFSTFQNMSVEKVLNLCKFYQVYKKTYNWECNQKKSKEVLFLYHGKKKVDIMEFCGADSEVFTDEYEMMQFLEFINYLENNFPEMEFHGKKFSEYGFCNLI